MPLYDVRCSKCLKKEEVLAPMAGPLPLSKCCKAVVSKLVSRCHTETDFWPKDGVFLEHASENGTLFKTRKELRKWCEAKGVESAALL